MAAGGLWCLFEFDEADLIYKSALCPPALCLLKANELEQEGTRDCTQTMARVYAHECLTWHTFIGWMINDRTKQIHEYGGENVCCLCHLRVLYVRLCVQMKGGCVGVRVKSGWMARAATVCRNSKMCTSSVRRWWALMPNKESQSTPIHSICLGDAF